MSWNSSQLRTWAHKCNWRCVIKNLLWWHLPCKQLMWFWPMKMGWSLIQPWQIIFWPDWKIAKTWKKSLFSNIYWNTNPRIIMPGNYKSRFIFRFFDIYHLWIFILKEMVNGTMIFQRYSSFNVSFYLLSSICTCQILNICFDFFNCTCQRKTTTNIRKIEQFLNRKRIYGRYLVVGKI